MFSRALQGRVTRFSVLCRVGLHVFPRFAWSGYMFSRALQDREICFPALCRIGLHVFPRFAGSGYIFPALGIRRRVTCFPRFTSSGYLFSHPKGTGKRGHIVAHDVSWARKRAGHEMNVVFPCCANWETFVAD